MLGIADHAVRDKVQYGKKRVIGALFGTQQGRSLEVVEVMGTGCGKLAPQEARGGSSLRIPITRVVYVIPFHQ